MTIFFGTNKAEELFLKSKSLISLLPSCLIYNKNANNKTKMFFNINTFRLIIIENYSESGAFDLKILDPYFSYHNDWYKWMEEFKKQPSIFEYIIEAHHLLNFK